MYYHVNYRVVAANGVLEPGIPCSSPYINTYNNGSQIVVAAGNVLDPGSP